MSLLAAAALVACSSGGQPVSQQTGAPTSATAAPATTVAAPPPPPPSDEDQIKETVLAYQDAYNTQNWDAYADLLCTAMRQKFTGVVMEMLKKTRHDNGLTQVKSITPQVTGDTAVVTMDAENETMGTSTVQLPLKREDGWKICVTR
ncbi:nuclear transport factor 2 family protein [Mycolicibacterium sp. BK634]|uniref:Rv0361 family membrane protein n=1 Tax=Mycolicibacterium sp. BK634 TaxID=2587099 RepID=UPI000D381EDB|nr:nuclear transport factor 2 family protein [Mycolicibacterium sp. BK634]